MREICVEDTDKDVVADELGQQLTKYNESQAGPACGSRLVLSIRDDDGSVIAGLTGQFFWNAIFIEVVWVRDDHRGSGYGDRLVRRAEAEARRRDCAVAYLTTFTFQAPGFYRKLDYDLLGELEGVPPGSKLLWLCKRLAPLSV